MKEQKKKRQWRWTTVDTLFWIGACLVSGGVGWLNPPVGLITAGAFALLGSFLTDRACGGGDGR